MTLENSITRFEKPKTFGETLYTHLKEAIITGEIHSEQRLQEREIAKQFNVSVTPVREAFRRLSAENFLTINARKEVIVTAATPKRTKELCYVLTDLDLLASKGALNNLTEKEVHQLTEMTEELAQFHQAGQVKSYMKLDLKIHQTIWRACGNEFLFQLLSDLAEKYAFYCNNIIAQAENPTSYLLIRDHLRIIEGLKRRADIQFAEIIASHWGKDLIADCS